MQSLPAARAACLRSSLTRGQTRPVPSQRHADSLAAAIFYSRYRPQQRSLATRRTVIEASRERGRASKKASDAHAKPQSTTEAASTDPRSFAHGLEGSATGSGSATLDVGSVASSSGSFATGSGGVFQPQPQVSHKRISDDPKHPELLSEEHSQRRMRRLILGLTVTFGAFGLAAFAEGSGPLRTEGLLERGDASDGVDTTLLTKAGDATNADENRFKPPLVLSSEEIDTILRAEAVENLNPGVAGIARFDRARVISNFPTEDTFIHQKLSLASAGEEWMAWGVFDGHAGSQISRILEKSLLGYVRNELTHLPSIALSTPPTTTSPADPTAMSSPVDAAIKRAFTSLDSDIMSPAASTLANGTLSLAQKTSALSPGYAGSCALLSLYDPSSRTLRVACTGDSRAVLGRCSSSGVWTATDLSVDQNGESPTELARLQLAHPDEPDMIKGKRIMGLAITRAFGDGRWKWDKETQEEAHRAYNGPKVRPQLKTPPYLTAEPEITTTRLEEGERSFVIMASDGLWEHMSSQQAVGLVGRWLDWQGRGRPKEKEQKEFEGFDFTRESEDSEEEWQIREEWETMRDGNAATHLARNALGGRNEDVLGAVLGFGPPRCREVRDDTTVVVAFFGEGWGKELPR